MKSISSMTSARKSPTRNFCLQRRLRLRLCLGYVKNNVKSAECDKWIQNYAQKAIVDLQVAVKKGFRDFNLMKKDLDLKELRALPEFGKPTASKSKKTGIGQAVAQGAVRKRHGHIRNIRIN